jgi:uncharacterized protein (DUF697 family)/GTP-binding protein EngB required for normal cell division
MKFFGKDKKLDAAARQQEAEFDLALAARISEVVGDHSHDVPDDALLDAPLMDAGWPVHANTDMAAELSTSYAPAQTQPAEHYAHPAGEWAVPAHVGQAEYQLEAASHALALDSAPDVATAPASPPSHISLPTTSLLNQPPVSGAMAYSSGDGALPGLPEMPANTDWTSPAALSAFAGAAPASAAPPSTARAPNLRSDAGQTFVALTTPAETPNSSQAIDELMQQTSMRLRSLGTVNILVAGQTGVGKSTLINAVFGEQFAQTAAGRPVTQRAQWFTSETVPLRILDTRGLEAKDYAITLNDMRAEIEACRAQKDERDQLHMAWVCIASPSSRVQDCEVDIVRVLNKHDIPAIIVLTKDDDDDEFAGIVGGIMDERRASYVSIVPVRALSKPKRAAAGLENLVIATFTALPAAHKAAFAAAQKINRDLNKMAADEYVIAAASAAAAASVIPIPFADMATIAPIQATMLVGVSNAFGLTLQRPQVMQLLTTVLGCLALSVAGGWAVGNLLKFIPGPGTAIGAVLNAGMAGAMTQGLGKTYIKFIYTFIETNGRVPTANEVFEIFPAFYKAGKDE